MNDLLQSTAVPQRPVPFWAAPGTVRAKEHGPAGVSPPYLIGLDYGTESARAILMRADGGAVLATAVHPYRHGVIERELRGTPLPRTFALQNAHDDLLAAEDVLRRVASALPEGGCRRGPWSRG